MRVRLHFGGGRLSGVHLGRRPLSVPRPCRQRASGIKSSVVADVHEHTRKDDLKDNELA